MRYYLVDTLGDLSSDYCILDSPPQGMGLPSYKLAKGEAATDDYPTDAKIYMTERYSGIKVPSLIGNTKSYLMVSEPMKLAVEAVCGRTDIEYLPFTLYNHKKRPVAGLRYIVNPLGARDCVNLDASEIERLNEPGDPYDGAVVGIDRLALDPRKLVAAPSMFRIPEELHRYVIDERLADALRSGAFTNVVLTEVEQSEAGTGTGKR